jgi:cobalt/nickel transport system permease protein
MHLPDGFLAPQLALALWVATALIVGISLRRLAASRDASGTAGRPILMGLVGAFIFAAQMFNFPVAAGTSGHLLGGVLAGYLLGPWAGTIVMTTVIGVQALLFQDGGLLALGANIFNMGIIGTLGGTLIARALAVALGGGRSARIATAGVAGWLSVMAGAGITALELGLSGTTDISVGLPAMLGVHVFIGVGEALITVAALTFITTTAPDLLSAEPSVRTSLARRVGAGAIATVVVITLATLFASADPDGLTYVAQTLGFSHVEAGAPFNLFAGYAIPGLDGTASTIVAALIGAALIVGIILLLSRLAASRTGDQ